MLTEEQSTLINESFAAVQENSPELMDAFFTRLFVTEPDLHVQFSKSHREKTLNIDAILQLALLAMQSPDTVVTVLQDVGVKNAKLGQSAAHYHIINEILIDTLAAEAGDIWTPEVSIAWATLLDFVGQTMIEGARKAEAGEPMLFGT